MTVKESTTVPVDAATNSKTLNTKTVDIEHLTPPAPHPTEQKSKALRRTCVQANVKKENGNTFTRHPLSRS